MCSRTTISRCHSIDFAASYEATIAKETIWT